MWQNSMTIWMQVMIPPHTVNFWMGGHSISSNDKGKLMSFNFILNSLNLMTIPFMTIKFGTWQLKPALLFINHVVNHGISKMKVVSGYLLYFPSSESKYTAQSTYNRINYNNILDINGYNEILVAYQYYYMWVLLYA